MREYIINFTDELHPFVFFILLVLAGIISGIIIKIMFFKLLKVYRKKTKREVRNSIREHLGTALAFFFPILMISFFITLVPFKGYVYDIFANMVHSAVTISFSWVLVKIVYVFEDYFYKVYEISHADNYRARKVRTQIQYLKKIVILIIIIIGFSAVLLTFENVRRIGAGLLTSAGIAGVIIGFAAQRSLANLLAGFQIAFTQPIRIDDVLIVENEWGKVEEITLTYVVVRIWDQRRLVLPIHYFIETPFQNWTRSTSELIGMVYIYTDYSLPLEPIRDELDRLLESNPLWDKRVSSLQVTNATERTMELRALISARNASDAWDLRCFVRENLIAFIQINYPQCLPKTRASFEGAKVGVGSSGF